MSYTRRTFIGSGVASITASSTLPAFLAASSAETNAAGNILVVVELTGGNDGLNTIVPYRSETYYKLRPTIAVPADRVHRLTDEVGLPRSLRGLHELWDDGLVSIVQGVGYPNPTRSHFKSQSVWQTAKLKPSADDQGWLNKVAEQMATRKLGTHAVHIGAAELPQALDGENEVIPSIDSMDGFLQSSEDTVSLTSLENPAASDDLLYLQRVSASSRALSAALQRVAESNAQQTGYPPLGLGRRLSLVSQLIKSGMSTSIYYTQLDGFDTHVNQRGRQPSLLREFGDASRAFFGDLAKAKLSDRVTMLVYSEFGRRVAENGTSGTDHGAAGPVLLIGGRVRSGLVGDAHDLTKLVSGDLAMQTDFRQIYAALLTEWLGVGLESVGREWPASLKLFN